MQNLSECQGLSTAFMSFNVRIAVFMITSCESFKVVSPSYRHMWTGWWLHLLARPCSTSCQNASKLEISHEMLHGSRQFCHKIPPLWHLHDVTRGKQALYLRALHSFPAFVQGKYHPVLLLHSLFHHQAVSIYILHLYEIDQSMIHVYWYLRTIMYEKEVHVEYDTL